MKSICVQYLCIILTNPEGIIRDCNSETNDVDNENYMLFPENDPYFILPTSRASQEVPNCDRWNINTIFTCLMVTSSVNIRKQRQQQSLCFTLCYMNKGILKAGEKDFPWEEHTSWFLFFTS